MHFRSNLKKTRRIGTNHGSGKRGDGHPPLEDQKLSKLLGVEYKLQMETKKQVKYISRVLENIKAFLRKVSDVQWYQLDEQTKAWAHEAREASYKMEDVLDTFLVCFSAHTHHEEHG